MLLVFGCGLIHLVTGQCFEVKKSEEKVEEAERDVWLPNRFHGKINVFFLFYFLFLFYGVFFQESKLYAIKNSH